MKNKYLILVLLLGLSGIFTMQSCTKQKEVTPVIYKADMPANPTPVAGGVLPIGAASYTLKWTGTTGSVDLYLGTSEDPPLAKAGVTGTSYTFTTTTGGHYFWYLRKKDANGVVSTSPVWDFYINSPPNVPVLTTPADLAVGFSVSGSLAWTATDPEGDDLTFDVYLGTSTSTLSMVGTGLTAKSYAPGFTANTLYFWKVIASDSHGAKTSSVIHSFTSGPEAIMAFVGNYTVDEPAEGWTYPVNFTKKTSTSLNIDQYWASWPAVFTLDFTNNTYTMAYTNFGGGYAGAEAGAIISTTTGKMEGTYTIWQNGKVIETGVHTYTKN